MAYIKALTVYIEILENNSWRRLAEFDIIDSLKEVANHAQRHTSAVETPPGHFRFLITVHETFDWSSANALQLLLTFDLGDVVNEYETLILRPGNSACELAEQLSLKQDAIMTSTKKNTAVYCLDSIGMPLELSSDDWYKAEFVFEKLGHKQDVDTLPIIDLAQVGHTEIRLDVIPCQASRDRKRPKKIIPPIVPRPDLLKNVFLGARLSYNIEGPVDKDYWYKTWCPPGKSKYTFVFLYSEVSRRKEIPPELIDYPQSSVEAKARKECSSASSKNTTASQLESRSGSAPSLDSPISNNTVPKQPDRQPASTPLLGLRRTPQNRQGLPSPSSENDERARSPQKKLFGNTIDWNMINGQIRSPTIPIVSPKSMTTTATTIVCPFIIHQDQPSTSDASLSEIRVDLGIVESAKREIQAEKLAARTRIRTGKVQNNHKILMVERKIDDTIGQLNDLKLEKEQLLRHQDDLNTQEIRLDDVDVDIEAHLLSATRSVRLYRDRQLQRLEVIRSNKKRRLSQTTPDRDMDTIAIKTPSLL